MGTQEWVYGLSIYFIFSFIVVTLFSMGGAFHSSEAQFATGSLTNYQKPNATAASGGLLGVNYSFGTWFKDIFSFFVWNINISETGLAGWLWIIRIILVYMPLMFLLVAIYYSLPTIGGG